MTKGEWLWTGESAYCTCTHHVEQHCTVHDQWDHVLTVHCNGRLRNSEYCDCRLFNPDSIRMDSFYFSSNDNKTLAEDLEYV